MTSLPGIQETACSARDPCPQQSVSSDPPKIARESYRDNQIRRRVFTQPGSKTEKLYASIGFPLCPYERTSPSASAMSESASRRIRKCKRPSTGRHLIVILRRRAGATGATPCYSLVLLLRAGGTPQGSTRRGVIMSQSQRDVFLAAAVVSSERLFDFFFGEKPG
jgi:hypothetical protein